MKMYRHRTILTTFIIILFAVMVNEAKAIPAFARKYRTGCSTCHIAVPNRNAFGEAFRRNGYVMPDGDEALIKQEPIPLGVDAWKEMFPDVIWPGFLPAEFPVSAYVHQRMVAEFGESHRGNQFELDMPDEFEIFIGGSFGERFSFFGEWVMFEHGENAPGLNRFIFQINDLFGPQNAFNIRMGRLEPAITEGYVDNNRITLSHVTTLDYHAGKWRPRDPQSGIELRGILGHRFQYAAGVVNGEGATVSDATDEKDFYGRVGAKFGGIPLDGFEPAGLTTLKHTDNWADNSLNFGAYFYSGNYLTSNHVDNDFFRFGADLHGNYNKFNLFAGAIFGRDNNPSGLISATNKERNLNSLAWFVEPQYLFFPWLIAGVRFGDISSNQNDNDIDKYSTILPNLTIFARENVRFTIEGLIKIESDRKVEGKNITGNDEKLRWIKINTLFVF